MEAQLNALHQGPESTSSKVLKRLGAILQWAAQSFATGAIVALGGFAGQYVLGRFVTGSIPPGHYEPPKPDVAAAVDTVNPRTGRPAKVVLEATTVDPVAERVADVADTTATATAASIAR